MQMASNGIYKIVVLGANGGIGMQTVQIALKAGHFVTAILRTPTNLQISHPNLQIVQGNVLKPEDLDRHFEDKNIIVSAIGRNSLKKTTLYSQGNKNVIESMQRVGVNRAFFVSASGLEVNPSFSLLLRFATKFILQPVLHNMYADLWRMEKMIKESNINWTILRPPKLLNRPETCKYRSSIDQFFI
jgi:putative NADH-flavin reductase